MHADANQLCGYPTNEHTCPMKSPELCAAISMNGKDVGVIDYANNGVIPPKGNITLSGLETTIDIGHFVGEIFSDVGSWLGSVFTGKVCGCSLCARARACVCGFERTGSRVHGRVPACDSLCT